MAISLSNFEKNIIVLQNTDNTAPILYTMEVLNDDEVFVPLPGYTSSPTTTLIAGGSLTISTLTDGIYKISTGDSQHFYLLDYNIKLCEKKIYQSILCDDCSTDCDPCDKNSYINKTYELLKFRMLKDNLYYIWNKYVQTQSFQDLTVASNDQIIYFKDLKDKIALYCDECSNSNCDECNQKNSSSSSNKNTGNCGCGC